MTRTGIGARVATEGAWLAGSQVVSAIATLASIRVLTELLSPDEFGRLALLVGVSTLTFGLTVGPLLQSVQRHYADWKRRGDGELLRSAATVAVGIVTIASCVMLFVAGWLGGPAFGEPFGIGIAIAALFAVDVIRSFELVLFNAARRQKQTAFLSAADACARPLIAVAAVLMLGPTAENAIAGYFLGSAVVVVSTRLAARLEGRAPRSLERGVSFLRSDLGIESARPFLHYSLPLIPLAALGWFNGVGDRYIIGATIGVSEAGLYAAAYGLVSRPFIMLSTMAELLMRPILLDSVAASDPERSVRAKRGWLALVGAGSAIGAILFFFLASFVCRIFLAPAYWSVAELMPWIAIGYLFFNLSGVYISICYAYNETRSVLALAIASSAAMVLVLLPFLELYALLGAALAVPVYFGIQGILSFVMARRAEAAFQLARCSEPTIH